MKNNRFVTILLAVTLIAVWGTIGYRILNGISTDESDEGAGIANNYEKSGSARYEYKDDVKDPFQLMPVAKKKIVVPAKSIQNEGVFVPPPYKLNGVIINKKRKVAILESNDGSTFFLSEGDSINGFKIVRIDGKNILFVYGGKSLQWKVE